MPWVSSRNFSLWDGIVIVVEKNCVEIQQARVISINPWKGSQNDLFFNFHLVFSMIFVAFIKHLVSSLKVSVISTLYYLQIFVGRYCSYKLGKLIFHKLRPILCSYWCLPWPLPGRQSLGSQWQQLEESLATWQRSLRTPCGHPCWSPALLLDRGGGSWRRQGGDVDYRRSWQRRPEDLVSLIRLESQ